MVLDALLPHQCLDFVDQLMEAESAEKSRIHDPEFGKPDKINKENIPATAQTFGYESEKVRKRKI